MIITDGVHLVSTESETELHEFAKSMGLKERWYQKHFLHPHYDLTTPNAVKRAIEHGAQKVDGPYLVKNAWWSLWKRKSS